MEILRDRLPVGSPERFAEKLLAYRDAGVQRVFIWPVTDELRQLELFQDKVCGFGALELSLMGGRGMPTLNM
jgi:alkanesulfonate monooxygenase SsuD/methylene tetrahydromethanopterin reductase-like flavin-dependent oxidoreductase (luciferase family)